MRAPTLRSASIAGDRAICPGSRSKCCDSELIQLDLHQRGFALYSTLTNSATVDSRGTAIPGQTLIVRRERTLHDGFAERLTIANYGHATVCLDVNINFDCDFEDIFVIRGVHRRAAPPPVTVELHGKPGALRVRRPGRGAADHHVDLRSAARDAW